MSADDEWQTRMFAYAHGEYSFNQGSNPWSLHWISERQKIDSCPKTKEIAERLPASSLSQCTCGYHATLQARCHSPTDERVSLVMDNQECTNHVKTEPLSLQVAFPEPLQSRLQPPSSSDSEAEEFSLTGMETYSDQPGFHFPKDWAQDLNPGDHCWIRSTLFHPNGELISKTTQMFHPPEVVRPPSVMPDPNVYVLRRLFLWTPMTTLSYNLMCPLCNVSLVSEGLHHRVNLVLDFTDFYYLANECLHCARCQNNYTADDYRILDQLPQSYRDSFPAVCTGYYNFTWAVTSMLCAKDFCGARSVLQNKIAEMHKEKWSKKQSAFLYDCVTYQNSGQYAGEAIPLGVQFPVINFVKWFSTLDDMPFITDSNDVSTSNSYTKSKARKQNTLKRQAATNKRGRPAKRSKRSDTLSVINPWSTASKAKYLTSNAELVKRKTKRLEQVSFSKTAEPEQANQPMAFMASLLSSYADKEKGKIEEHSKMISSRDITAVGAKSDTSESSSPPNNFPTPATETQPATKAMLKERKSKLPVKGAKSYAPVTSTKLKSKPVEASLRISKITSLADSVRPDSESTMSLEALSSSNSPVIPASVFLTSLSVNPLKSFHAVPDHVQCGPASQRQVSKKKNDPEYKPSINVLCSRPTRTCRMRTRSSSLPPKSHLSSQPTESAKNSTPQPQNLTPVVKIPVMKSTPKIQSQDFSLIPSSKANELIQEMSDLSPVYVFKIDEGTFVKCTKVGDKQEKEESTSSDISEQRLKPSNNRKTKVSHPQTQPFVFPLSELAVLKPKFQKSARDSRQKQPTRKYKKNSGKKKVYTCRTCGLPGAGTGHCTIGSFRYCPYVTDAPPKKEWVAMRKKMLVEGRKRLEMEKKMKTMKKEEIMINQVLSLHNNDEQSTVAS